MSASLLFLEVVGDFPIGSLAADAIGSVAHYIREFRHRSLAGL